MNIPTKNILFALALPALIIVQTTHSMELPSRTLSLRIRLNNLPTEIQTHILGYVFGYENWCTIAKHTIPHNPTGSHALATTKGSKSCCENCAQYSALEYIKQNSFITKIISKDDFSKRNQTSDTIKINAAHCHLTLDVLAISTYAANDGKNALYIFKKTKKMPLAILGSRGSRIAFHPTKPILASTNERKIDILHIGNAIRDQDRFNFPNEAPACTIASFEMPNRKFHSANHIQSISFDQTGNFLKVISGDGKIDIFTCYTNADHPNRILDQLLLEQTIKVELKKPKSVPALPIITEDKDVPKITENELALIMGGCTIL